MPRPSRRKPIIDLRPVIDRLGLCEVIKVFGEERVLAKLVDEMGTDWLVDQLTPAQRRELKRLLEDNGDRQ
jgi:hypothetical protein